jgi:hypothetical protein
LIGVWTLAVAVMLALFVWAWSAVLVRTRAATTRDSFVMLRISLLLFFGVELLVSWSAIRLLQPSECCNGKAYAIRHFLSHCQIL